MPIYVAPCDTPHGLRGLGCSNLGGFVCRGGCSARAPLLYLLLMVGLRRGVILKFPIIDGSGSVGCVIGYCVVSEQLVPMHESNLIFW